MSGIDGAWDVALKTPIGTITVRYEFYSIEGIRHGRAVGKHEATSVEDIHVVDRRGGQTVTWRQNVTKPLRLSLAFEVTVHGDELHGHSRAGRLPRSSVTGHRVPTDANDDAHHDANHYVNENVNDGVSVDVTGDVSVDANAEVKKAGVQT